MVEIRDGTGWCESEGHGYGLDGEYGDGGSCSVEGSNASEVKTAMCG